MTRAATQEDSRTLGELANLLWPHGSVGELTEEFSQLLPQRDAGVFLKYVDGIPVGFAQCQLRRDYVEGTESSPVGYLEGIFVREDFRRLGFARELLKACEDWAAARGCTEFASDCQLDNVMSFRFHMNMGFIEANRIICFTKKLEG